mmetsp:Transcript_13678/g.37442  ORF Transcript_13678/g.37442 Transcript_13678/m.37442 type:complete len:245 (-) Transcript_13678:75-809(-)
MPARPPSSPPPPPSFPFPFPPLFRFRGLLGAVASFSVVCSSSTAFRSVALSFRALSASRSIFASRSLSFISRPSALSRVCTRVSWSLSSGIDLNASCSSHSGRVHRNIRSVACTRACCLKCSASLNPLPHPSTWHLNGFSVPCVATCFSIRARPWLVTKSQPGIGHVRIGAPPCGWSIAPCCASVVCCAGRPPGCGGTRCACGSRDMACAGRPGWTGWTMLGGGWSMVWWPGTMLMKSCSCGGP